MRLNSSEYDALAQNKERELRLVITIEYSGDTYYFTSHDDIGTPAPTSVHASLIKTNAKTQRYIPEQARSEIGRLSFSLLDVGEAVSDMLNDEQFNNDEGPKGKTVVLYRGFASLAWAKFRKEMTQIIDGRIKFKDGAYDFSCSDKLSSLKKNVFAFPITRLSAAVTATDITLSVYTTTDFDVVPQGTSYSYLPSTSVIMLRIKYQDSYEICSATGKTATTFTGVVRGLFGTVARAHDLPSGANEDNGVEIEYYPFLELPVAKLIYALLTGKLLNQGGATLPAAYHLGIAEADLDQDSFEQYIDWYDTTDDTKGLILRFEGGAMSETDGKAFIEKECLKLINAFLLVEPDGRLSLRRKVAVLSSSDYISELNEKVIVNHGSLEHDLNGVAAKIRIIWGYREFGPNNKGYYREKTLTDTVSLARFPDSKTRTLQFKGLHPARHTTTILKGIFESHRDAVASPPLYLSGVELMPSIGFDVEVADVHLVDLTGVNDYQDLLSVTGLQRPFEVRRITINQQADSVKADFVGSATSATEIGDDDDGNAVIANSAYTSTGTNLTGVISIDGSGFTTADGTLTGGTTTRTRYYHDGDLTISAGDTIDFSGNIEIWVKGHFSVQGILDGIGGGYAADLSGVLGSTGAGGAANNPVSSIDITFSSGQAKKGKFDAIPALMIENTAGVLTGIPADLRGSGGPKGSDSSEDDGGVPLVSIGGLGGAGGGSVVIVCRGFSFGASGSINVSGANGVLGATGGIYTGAGSGGGGAAGGVLVLIDGSGNSVPIIAGKIIADRGSSPTPVGSIATRDIRKIARALGTIWFSYVGLKGDSQFSSNVRVQYVSVSRTAFDDTTEGVEIPSNISATGVEGGIKLDWDNPTNSNGWDLVEVWTSTTNLIDNASKIYEGRISEFFHKTDDAITRYYWLRTRISGVFSGFTPNTPTTSITATPLTGLASAATTANYSGVVDDLSVTDPTSNPTRSIEDIQLNLFQMFGAWLRSTQDMGITGYEGSERITGDIFGGSDGGTRLIDIFNMFLDGLQYSSGNSVDSLEPAAANADVTSANTAANTTLVGGTTAATVESGAAAGATASQATGVANNADVTSANTAANVTTVGGTAAATVESGAALGASSSQATGVANNADVTSANTSDNTTNVDERSSADTVQEVFALAFIGFIRSILGSIGGYEGASTIISDIYGGSDGGTLLLDTLNQDYVGNINGSAAGTFANLNNLASDEYGLTGTIASASGVGTTVNKWTLDRDGSANTSVASSTTITVADTGVYLISGTFDITLTQSGNTDAAKAEIIMQILADTGSGYFNLRYCGAFYPTIDTSNNGGTQYLEFSFPYEVTTANTDFRMTFIHSNITGTLETNFSKLSFLKLFG